jgi:hypothetical protein
MLFKQRWLLCYLYVIVDFWLPDAHVHVLVHVLLSLVYELTSQRMFADLLNFLVNFCRRTHVEANFLRNFHRGFIDFHVSCCLFVVVFFLLYWFSVLERWNAVQKFHHSLLHWDSEVTSFRLISPVMCSLSRKLSAGDFKYEGVIILDEEAWDPRDPQPFWRVKILSQRSGIWCCLSHWC